jgi:transcriptional regulator with XRE-family HTH domain
MLKLNVEKLRAYMEIKSWSERELARRMGLSHSAVNRVLRGEREPGRKFIDRVLLICQGLTFYDLFYQNPFPNDNINFTQKLGYSKSY